MVRATPRVIEKFWGNDSSAGGIFRAHAEKKVTNRKILSFVCIASSKSGKA